jgi:NADPH:quinone reductase-like Zn-dependent oxidoreductase
MPAFILPESRSDVNFSSGKYFGSEEKALSLLPFGAGLEAVGVVAAVGPGTKDLVPGTIVASMMHGEHAAPAAFR